MKNLTSTSSRNYTDQQPDDPVPRRPGHERELPKRWLRQVPFWAGGKRPALVPLIVCLLPAAVFAGCLARYAIDIPYIDDFHLYTFLLRIRSAATWSARFGAFFVQTNEHRAAFARLSTWALYELTGQINLTHLMWEGFLTLLGVVWLLGRVFRTLQVSWYWFLPVPCLLFMLQGWSNYFWGFCAVSNIAVLGWMLLSLSCLGSGRMTTGFSLALVFALLATFSTASGLMTFLAGGTVLALQRRWRYLIIWLFVAGGVALLYFHDFEKKSQQLWEEQFIHQIVSNWFTYAGNFVELWGAKSGAFLPLCFGTGVLLSGLALGGLVKEFMPLKRAMPKNTAIFLAGLVVYLALTTGLVALSRSSMIEDRYKINSALLAVTTYLLWVPVLNKSSARRWLAAGVLLFTGLLFAYSYVRYLPDVLDFRHGLLSNQYSILSMKQGAVQPFYTRIAALQEIGAYRLPNAYEREFAPLQTLKGAKADLVADSLPSLRIREDSVGLTFTDSTFRWNNERDEALYAVLHAPEGTAVMNIHRESASLAHVLTTRRWFQPGGRGFIAYEWFNPGRYHLYLLVRSNGVTRLMDTGRMVNNRFIPTPKWLE